ncbi:hypothetical protein Tco_1252335 [Tanacetum coccineum]
MTMVVVFVVVVLQPAGSVEGQVIEMGLTTTSLLSAEKFPIVVPNSLFFSQDLNTNVDNVGVEQLGVLYGDVNWKMFEVSMLKPSLMSGLRRSLFFDGEQRVGQSRSEENEESKKGQGGKPSTILEVNWLEKQWSIIDKLVSSVVERFVETGLRKPANRNFVLWWLKYAFGSETIDGLIIDHTIWSHVAAAADT